MVIDFNMGEGEDLAICQKCGKPFIGRQYEGDEECPTCRVKLEASQVVGPPVGQPVGPPVGQPVGPPQKTTMYQKITEKRPRVSFRVPSHEMKEKIRDAAGGEGNVSSWIMELISVAINGSRTTKSDSPTDRLARVLVKVFIGQGIRCDIPEDIMPELERIASEVDLDA